MQLQRDAMPSDGALAILISLIGLSVAFGNAADQNEPQLTYHRFDVVEKEGRVVATRPIPAETPPRWARDVPQKPAAWSRDSTAGKAFFLDPIPFVRPPLDKGEPFYSHNHQPAITWLNNGDLLAIWYSTNSESGTELTVLASRFRADHKTWDPSSEFFKASRRNMHGSSIFHDGKKTVYHFNGMGPEDGKGWSKLVLLMRSSDDNGVTWTSAEPISNGADYELRNQVIAGTLMTREGTLIQACDATPGGEGPSAVHVSSDGGKSWTDPGGDIRGIHAGVCELTDGRLMALGRGQPIDNKMPISLSTDLGRSWNYRASPFTPIGGGQRLVLLRLNEGPLLLCSFTSGDLRNPTAHGMTFRDDAGSEFIGHGLFAALSFDDGETWPVRKLLTPGRGDYNGGGHTGPFTASRSVAEHAGYLAATQSPDDTIHLISSRLHYRFNLAWLNSSKPN